MLTGHSMFRASELCANLLNGIYKLLHPSPAEPFISCLNNPPAFFSQARLSPSAWIRPGVWSATRTRDIRLTLQEIGP